jgi:hypothetical protein
LANQTVTTAVNYDAASISGLLDGELITVNGGSLTINADTRWNQQAAVFGNITVSSTLGGVVAIDGTQVWEVPFSVAVGLVPTQAALGSNTVTGGTSGATGELTRVWASGSFTPAAAGAVMPLAGFIKLRSKTGNFQAGETITLPGGATIVAANTGKRSWIHVVGEANRILLMPRLASVPITGDWYALGATDGTDSQTIQMPVRDEFPAVQIETSPGSGVYEWWANAADAWNGWYPNNDNWTLTNATITRNAVAGPANYPAGDRLRETTANGNHLVTGINLQSAQMDAGSYTHEAIVKSDGRQWCVVQISTNGGADRYGALVDLSAGTIIANPSVGSPTGVSSSITSLGSGYYQVNVTLTHVTGDLRSFVAIADSATPTYTTGLPTYTGNTGQGIILGFSTVKQATHAFISTDARGKFFYSDPFAGTIQLAKRGSNNAGLKPASGCAIRIPNIILGTSSSGDYTSQHLSSTTGSNAGVARYAFGVTNAVVDFDKVSCNWSLNGNAPTSWKVQNSGWSLVISLLNFYSEIRNVCIAPTLYTRLVANGAYTHQNSANAYMYDSRVVSRGQGAQVYTATACANINAYRTSFESIGPNQGKAIRSPFHGIAAQVQSAGGEFVDCTTIGGRSTFNAQNFLVKNLTYCDYMIGTTTAVASTAIGVQGTSITVDNILPFPGVANNHPFTEYVVTTGFIANLVLKNIGSPTSPLNVGTVNPCGAVLTQGAAGTTAEVRRVYTTNLRLGVVSTAAANPVLNLFDVWGDGTTPQTLATANINSRGGRWTNQRGANAVCTGSHWDDAYNSTTTGRITISGNEPSVASAAQCSFTLGTGSGFNGNGSVVISRLTDVVTWTTPYKMYGHNAFAGGCALLGTDCQNLIFEYKVDTGSGFGGSWAFLANTVRRAGGGTSGTNTVTVTTADRTALTRQPQVGDFVQTGSFRLPANTTVTNISGDVITCSNNFTANLTTSEFVTFSPVNVAVSAANGYALQVRTYPTAAATTTLLTAFTMGLQTDATAQQIPHPLPGSLVNITNLVPQSRVKVSRVDTGVTLQQASCGASTSLAFDFQYTGAVEVEARNTGGTPTYEPWVTQVTISPATPTNIAALQEPD